MSKPQVWHKPNHGWRKRKDEILTHERRPEAVQWMRWQIWKTLESSDRASLCTHVVKLSYSVTEIINLLKHLIQLMPGICLLTNSRSLGNRKADHVDNSIAPSTKADPRFLWNWMKWKEQMMHVTVKPMGSLNWRSNGAVDISAIHEEFILQPSRRQEEFQNLVMLPRIWC
jgi:hypothetical protein